jgi:hypothetical protein
MTTQNIVTPKGVLVYPHLNKADTKFDVNGVWRAGLRLEKKDADNLIQQITDEIEANAADETAKRGKKVKVANPPYSEDNDGNIIFNFKLKAGGTRANGEAWSQRPVLYDSKGNVFDPQGKIIWGGTSAKIAFQLARYHVGSIGAGISLRMKAVQILDLVSGDGNASSYGFKEEEGFESPKPTVETNEVPADNSDF